MKEENVIKNLIHRIMIDRRKVSSRSADEQISPIRFEAVSLILGIVLSLVILLCEIFYARWRKSVQVQVENLPMQGRRLSSFHLASQTQGRVEISTCT